MADEHVPPGATYVSSESGEDPAQGESVIAPPDPVRPARGATRAIDGQTARSRTKPRRAQPVSRARRGVRIALIVVLVLVLIIAGGLVWVWFSLSNRLDHQDVDGILGSDRPSVVQNSATATVRYPGDPFAGRPMNILVMGTDSREGANAGISHDNPGGARADTTFIAHVSADRTRVDAVSIPRDTYITIPDCVDQQGKKIKEAGWMRMGFNAAFSYGAISGGSTATGAACTIRAVEAMSDVRIDAYVVVDFMGFVNVVDAVGGVDVTLACPIKSAKAGGLELPAGVNHVDGYQAVDLARTLGRRIATPAEARRMLALSPTPSRY